QYQEAIVDDVSTSTVYGAEHLLGLFGKNLSKFLFRHMDSHSTNTIRLPQVSNLISFPFSTDLLFRFNG
ncbi:unnamed protein product, partial [Brassica rapa subsp. narinosa]